MLFMVLSVMCSSIYIGSVRYFIGCDGFYMYMVVVMVSEIIVVVSVIMLVVILVWYRLVMVGCSRVWKCFFNV